MFSASDVIAIPTTIAWFYFTGRFIKKVAVSSGWSAETSYLTVGLGCLVFFVCFILAIQTFLYGPHVDETARFAVIWGYIILVYYLGKAPRRNGEG